jgi:hypothetical protein
VPAEILPGRVDELPSRTHLCLRVLRRESEAALVVGKLPEALHLSQEPAEPSIQQVGPHEMQTKLRPQARVRVGGDVACEQERSGEVMDGIVRTRHRVRPFAGREQQLGRLECLGPTRHVGRNVGP